MSYSSVGIQAPQNRCLLANDNAFLLQAFAETLEVYFDQVDKAEDGKIAVDKVLAYEPNYYQAIVLDISMPVMDGVEACSNIIEYLSQDKPLLPPQIEESKEES